MIGLAKSTEVRRSLPKTQVYRQFGWTASQRDGFDADVARLDFVNWISPHTLPAIAEGEEVKEIFVVEVSLKRRDFDTKSIILLVKSIPQKVIYLLRFENKCMLAVYHTKLFLSPWHKEEDIALTIEGLNLDTVWQNMVSLIGNFSISSENTLSQQIKIDEEKAKIQKQIDALERQLKSSRQPRRKRELFLKIQQLKLSNQL